MNISFLKPYFILLFSTFSILANAQDSQTKENQPVNKFEVAKKKITNKEKLAKYTSLSPEKQPAFYIQKMNNLNLVEASKLKYIESKEIKEVRVFKEQDALDRFGADALYGAVVIILH